MMGNRSVINLYNVIVKTGNEHGPAYVLPPGEKSHVSIMASNETQHQEAYYLYFVGAVGMVLNCVVIICIFVRKTLRKLTSAFLIHCCFLNFLKAMYCIPFGSNLIRGRVSGDCTMEGATYILIITASTFNLVAMICTEAYTFGETNVGGNSRGSACCILFGILSVYIASTILHLGPTLIGGYFNFNSEIGSCSFILGEATGYIANVMWIIIISLALIAVTHFLCKFYKEIQLNQPNRVSMLVRTSITIMDEPMGKQSATSVRALVEESTHRAKIFVMTAIAFLICWYPLFLLILIDVHFRVSPKVYQTFSFIAWSQGTIEPILYVCFDRNLNLLAGLIYCDRYRRYNRETIAYLMSQHRQPSRQNSAANAEPIADHVPCRHCHNQRGHGYSGERSPSPASTFANDENQGLDEVEC